MLLSPELIFPHLGITINKLISGFDIGSLHIAFYGVVIAIGMILAVVIGMHRAKKTNQYADDYIDIGIISIIAAIVGARIYYVIFSLDEFQSFVDVINIKNGGLAIYGGIIGGVLATFFVCRYKKISFLRVLDTAAPGIVLAQAIGRWGNFFNKEAFGGYTDSLFAMQIRTDAVGGVISKELEKNMVTIDGVSYIQCHPTFLYESVWCLLVFIIIMLVSRFQQYNGEVLMWYVGGYALERAFVEGLRTDQLRIGSIAVSQLLSIALLAAALVLLVFNRVRIATGKWTPDFKLILADGDPGTKAHHDERTGKKEKKKKAKWEMYTVSSGEKDGETKQETTEEADPEVASQIEEAAAAAERAEEAEEIAEAAEAVEEAE